MEMLRDVSNTRYGESVFACKCGYTLINYNTPTSMLGIAFKRLPSVTNSRRPGARENG
jgi:hypothetical protein